MGELNIWVNSPGDLFVAGGGGTLSGLPGARGDGVGGWSTLPLPIPANISVKPPGLSSMAGGGGTLGGLPGVSGDGAGGWSVLPLPIPANI